MVSNPGPRGNPPSTAAGGLGVTMRSSSNFEPDASNRAASPGARSTLAPSCALCGNCDPLTNHGPLIIVLGKLGGGGGS
jgi:hypothetical protein